MQVPYPSRLLNKSHVLSASYGACGKAPFAANVDHLGKEGNEVHRLRMKRPSGGSGARADCVGPLGKVNYITGEARLISTRARASELLRLVQQPAMWLT